MLLAGDIGGTNTRLVLCDERKRLRVVAEKVLPSRSYASLEAAVTEFLGARPPRIAAAAFGIAGPVVGGKVKTTNLPWLVDERVLSRRLRIPRVRLLNDLVSIAYGASLAPRSKLHVLQGGAPRPKGATVAVLAAGTGLGEAALVWDGAKHVPCGSEGGHTDLAPRNEEEWALLQHLIARLGGRVSYERVVSGPGLGSVYEFVTATGRAREEEAVARELSSAPDRNRLIAERGKTGASPACAMALRMFLGLYGAEAGNLALKFLATGGVFVAGGIAASLVPLLEDGGGPFLAGFRDKGRFRELLEKTPVAVVLDPNVGLFGATRFAASLVA